MVLDFGKGVIKCVKTTFPLQFIFRLFQESGRYMNFGEKVMSVFCSATIITIIIKFTYAMGIFFNKVEIIFPQHTLPTFV